MYEELINYTKEQGIIPPKSDFIEKLKPDGYFPEDFIYETKNNKTKERYFEKRDVNVDNLSESDVSGLFNAFGRVNKTKIRQPITTPPLNETVMRNDLNNQLKIKIKELNDVNVKLNDILVKIFEFANKKKYQKEDLLKINNDLYNSYKKFIL